MAETKAGSLDARRITISLTGSASDESVSHSLGRVPREAFIVDQTTNANIFRGTAAWTSTTIFLRASAAVSGTLILF